MSSNASSFLTVLAAGVTRTKWGSPGLVRPSTGWFGVIRESFSGAFQANVEVDAPRDVLAFSAVFACVSLISSDIAKLNLRLMRRAFNGNTWAFDDSAPQADVLRKPNHYQTPAQFISLWILLKLLYGNTFVLKERDARGVVTALYLLDPSRVKPLVTPLGDVYYQLSTDYLSHLDGTAALTVPAREIIHDRMNCLWHPLVGVSPLYAAGLSATQGRKIQNNSALFFQNMSRPSGMLSAPQTISDETALRLKQEFESAFAGSGMGRLFVAGDDLRYEAMTIPAADAQLIEQLDWAARDVARAFRMPAHKIGIDAKQPSNLSIEAQQQLYLNDCLQSLIEDLEQCLDLGLALPGYQRCEFDLGDLLRMDSAQQADATAKLVGAGVMAPNEGRARFNLGPVAGGDSPMIQQQNWSLEQLSRRDKPSDGGQAVVPPGQGGA
jgi:HK97 family phage portal protein